MTAVDPHAARARHRPWPRRCPGIALDLGSARTRAWMPGHGLLFDVPTVTFGDGPPHPIRRGVIVDTPGTARMLDRLLGHRLPRLGRPLVILAAPVLGGMAFRTEARTAAEALRPQSVLTVPAARAVAEAAGTDLGRPLLVADIGAQVTDVVLLIDGTVADARRTAVGTGDIDRSAPPARITEAVIAMVSAILDDTPQTRGALRRGILLAGGGALRPDLTYRLTEQLQAPVRPVPAPHTAAVRGAAALLQSVHGHPSVATPASGDSPHPP
ncbi:rod shape-determining protein [Streptomyces nigra]|uniref:rod shape-determining protein n=1 Tax=Streptomyces nigra TaxID=1827580 RepID=UPI003696DDCF